MGKTKVDTDAVVVKSKSKLKRSTDGEVPKHAKSSFKSSSSPKLKSKSTSKTSVKKSAPSKKSSKKRERMDEPVASDDEDEVLVLGDDNQDEDEDEDDAEDEEEDEVMEALSDDEDNVKESKNATPKTEKEKEEEEEKKRRRRNMKARRRGYRVVAKRGGYSADPSWSTRGGSFDVAVPITTPSEAMRAAKWAPAQTSKAAFDGLTEYEERVSLSFESLPKSAARVLQAHGEQYLRSLTTQTIQTMSDQLKTRASAGMVASVTRPLKRVQKYSFVAPKGLVRYSQESAKGLRIEKFDGEMGDIEDEKVLLQLQGDVKKQIEKRAELVKAGAADKNAPPVVKASLKKVDDELKKIRAKAAEASLA